MFTFFFSVVVRPLIKLDIRGPMAEDKALVEEPVSLKDR